MLWKALGVFVGGLILLTLAVLLFTVPAMLIWNAYAVPTFGAPELGFWRSFWLLILAKVICSNTSASVK